MNGNGDLQKSPYIGPRAFREEEHPLFCGRDDEIDILAGMAMARRASLLFAQSGAGKSSLLRAGLIHQLTQERIIGSGSNARAYQNMYVLPILSVASIIPLGTQKPITNIFISSALYTLYPNADPDQLADQTLSQALAPHFSQMQTNFEKDPDLEAVNTLVIFDQFEELFSRHLDHWQEREGFFRQVNQALADYPQLHVLFSMREDFIAELTPFASLLPDQLRSRFRLERLTPENAILAVTKPAAQAGRPFDPDVAEQLVDNLRSISIETSDEKGHHIEKTLGNYVEPVHLQIVCFDLWNRLPPDRASIRSEDIEIFGNVNEALAGFYDRNVEKVCQETGISQRRLRAWFEEKLITPSLTRNLVYRDVNDTAGLPNASVDLLKETYLIRSEIRSNGQIWYELAHDRLIEPVRSSNEIWRQKNLTYFQTQAALWEHSGRNNNLLLKHELLLDLGKSAAIHPEELEPYESDFLKVSQELADKNFLEVEVQYLKKTRRSGIRVFASVIAIVVIPILILVTDNINGNFKDPLQCALALLFVFFIIYGIIHGIRWLTQSGKTKRINQK